MLEEIKTIIRAAVKAFGARIAPIEDDVKTLKADVDEVKGFIAEIRNGGLDDLRAEIEGIAGKSADPAPQPTAGDHPDPDMATAGLPAAGPLPTAA